MFIPLHLNRFVYAQKRFFRVRVCLCVTLTATKQLNRFNEKWFRQQVLGRWVWGQKKGMLANFMKLIILINIFAIGLIYCCSCFLRIQEQMFWWVGFQAWFMLDKPLHCSRRRRRRVRQRAELPVSPPRTSPWRSVAQWIHPWTPPRPCGSQMLCGSSTRYLQTNN